MQQMNRTFARMRNAVMLAAVGTLAACASPPPPPPAPPPPPVVEVIPPRPVLPADYPQNPVVPPLGADGLHHTVLTDSTGHMLVWNLRAALNVAALNCREATYLEITRNYGVYLKAQAKPLAAANKAGDAAYKAQFGKDGIAQRETYLTAVYNFFAYPPTLPRFCQAALEVSREAAQPHPEGLENYSTGAFAKLGRVWADFYAVWDKYQAEAAQWDARYGARAAQTDAGGGASVSASPMLSVAPVVPRQARP